MKEMSGSFDINPIISHIDTTNPAEILPRFHIGFPGPGYLKVMNYTLHPI